MTYFNHINQSTFNINVGNIFMFDPLYRVQILSEHNRTEKVSNISRYCESNVKGDHTG